MRLRPAITVPLPWIIVLYGRFFGKKAPPRAIARRGALFKFPRSLSFTGEGKLFMGILFLVAIAAINTGNNLLYLLIATLLSLIVISGIMSESVLAKLNARRVSFPHRAFKGSSLAAGIEITNNKGVFPSFSFNVRESPAPDVASTPAYVLKLKAGGTVVMTSTYMFTRRGQFTLRGIKVSTRFPFGLFIKGKEEETEDRVLVYPAVRPVKAAALSRFVSDTHGETSSAGKGDGTELYGLRDYTPDDDSRRIHWRSAARTGRLLVKEYENETEKTVFVVFDNTGGADEAVFEELVDEAASLAAHFIRRDYAVGLMTLDREIRPACGKEQLERILHALALIGPSERKGRPGVRLRA